jgi:hypothetical protein
MTRRLWIGLLLLFDFLPLWSLMCCLSEKPMANYWSEVFLRSSITRSVCPSLQVFFTHCLGCF